MNGHALAALEGKEGAERAREDFAKSVTVNPFGPYAKDGWRGAAWKRQTTLLICRRDHDRAKCCWEHDYHIHGRANRYQWGIGSCSACEAAANVERAIRAKLSAEA